MRGDSQQREGHDVRTTCWRSCSSYSITPPSIRKTITIRRCWRRTSPWGSSRARHSTQTPWRRSTGRNSERLRKLSRGRHWRGPWCDFGEGKTTPDKPKPGPARNGRKNGAKRDTKGKLLPNVVETKRLANLFPRGSRNWSRTISTGPKSSPTSAGVAPSRHHRHYSLMDRLLVGYSG